MLTFTLILFLIACGGFIFSIVQIIRNTIKKQDNKKNKKILIGCIVLAVVALAIPVESSKSNDSKTVSTQVQEKSKEKTPEEIEVEKKAKAEEAKKKEEERKAKESEEAKVWNEFVAKNTKQLPAGEHIVGTHLDAGAYDVTFNGSGNFFVYANDGSLLTNEIGGSDMGISKYRSILSEGSKVKMSGLSINVKPVKRNLMSYSNINLYAGYWVIGQDVTKGRYKVTPVAGSGNFIIYDKNGLPKTNEILGEDMGVNEVVVNLDDEDIINISGISNVKFNPTN